MCRGRHQTALLSLLVLLLLGPVAPTPAPTACAFNSMCTCSPAEVACVGVPLHRLPGLPRRSLHYVEVLSAGLTTLEDAALAGLSVASLRFTSNRLIHIASHAFAPTASELYSLDLSHNHLQEVPLQALRPLVKLQWLSLHGNQITSLEGDWSHLKETLMNLYLGENDLSALVDRDSRRPSYSAARWSPNDVLSNQGSSGGDGNGGFDVSGTLADFRRLQTLELDGNKLNALTATSLPTSLRSLSAQHNALVRLPTEVLDRLPHLSRVLLRGNLIRTLPQAPLAYNRSLEVLDLGDNNIQILPPNSFNHTLAVRELHLDQNYIKILPSNAFRGLGSAKLYLANNRIENVHEKTFVDLSYTLEHLDLDSNSLKEVPVKSLSHLRVLRYLLLSNNNLKDIPSETFASFGSNLKGLSISGNQISQFPVSALRKCDKLSYLNIGYNSITKIQESDFFGWASVLDTLLLSNNLLSQIGPRVFRLTPKLHWLNLSFNKLHDVDPEAFVDLAENLQTLEASFCFSGDDFPEETLRPLTSLRWLVLDNNNIRFISADALLPLKNLKFLNLEANLISELPAGVLNSSVHRDLQELRLGYNNLTVVTTDALTRLQSLQTVILSGNYLKIIETGAFNNLPNIQQILLSDNSLIKLHPRAFHNLPYLNNLDMHNNKLNFFSLSAFVNVSSPDVPLVLNVSLNHISELFAGDTLGSPMYIETLDLSHNFVAEIQVKFLSGVSAALKRLYLSFNRISRLENLGVLQTLEVLYVDHNNIVTLMPRVFQGCDLLQIILLSHNHINVIHSEQFAKLVNLRILDLSHNQIRSIPMDAFSRTQLEDINLSHNELLAVPIGALAEVGHTLRSLGLAYNHIEHLDSTVFPGTPLLQSLDLTGNRLSFLPDNVFSALGGLLSLRLGWNPLRANLAELFHYVHGLRVLGLEGVGLRSAPPLPLPSLVSLNLSCNAIESLRAASGATEGLGVLRSLDVRFNKLSTPPSAPLLSTLDLSSNPIKSLTQESFTEVPHLQELTLRDLPLERMDVNTFQPLRALRILRTQTWPKLGPRYRLGAALAGAPSLRVLAVHVPQPEPGQTGRMQPLSLSGALRPTLKRLQLSGSGLKTLPADSLGSLSNHRQLTLQVSGSGLSEFPSGLFSQMAHIAHLSLDLQDNHLSGLAPDTFYRNSSSWERTGTTLISGGINLKGNPLQCGCSLSWVGAWLRRWLREVLEVHKLDAVAAVRLREAAQGAVCKGRSGRQIPLLRLRAAGCRASALSAGATESRPTPFLMLAAVFGFVFQLWSRFS